MKITSIATKLFICAVVMFFVCMAPVMAQETNDAIQDPLEEGPTIVFDATKFEFGSVLESDLVTHQYTFKNTGTKDLEIKQVKTA
ncbi:MAG: DUF1573 domain-containing protein [Desulfatibacillum sp.]|nr:DUF1573 domain-containing protein [Desulfatibacillum sp.]